MTTLNVIAEIAIIVIGVVVVVELIVATLLLVVVRNLTLQVREHLDPLASKANTLLTTANEMAEKLQDRTEDIADQAAHTTSVVGTGVETTSRLMQRIVATPIIRGSAAMAGFRRGINIWRTLRRARKIEPPRNMAI